MSCSAKDIQPIELKDTISKLNELIMTQTKSMESLQKTIEGLRQELGNKQAEVDYMATTYECSVCKDSLEPQFIKDEGAAAAPWFTGQFIVQ